MLINSYPPLNLELSPDPPSAEIIIPPDVRSPHFGKLNFGAPDRQSHSQPHVVLLVDEPPDRPARLFVDANHNGDLTDDPLVDWHASPIAVEGEEPLLKYKGWTMLPVGTGTWSGRVMFERWDTEARHRLSKPDSLTYYRDYTCAGEFELSGKRYRFLLDDELVCGDFRGRLNTTEWEVGLRIDANQNGAFETRGEFFDARQPFNIGGTTYEITELQSDGTQLTIVESSAQIPEVPPPPVLAVGEIVPSFEATSIDGRLVRFPHDFAGKIVLLNFWATWCGPCRREIPFLVEAHRRYSDQRFDIVSVALETSPDSNSLRKLVTDSGMNWIQINDGNGWEGRIFALFYPQGIPWGCLVEGDTGRILAVCEELRQDKLDRVLVQHLPHKAPLRSNTTSP